MRSPPRRWLLVLIAAGLIACADEVVLGRFFPLNGNDAGVADAGGIDGGEVDAGEVDAGASDAGAADGGPDASVFDLSVTLNGRSMVEHDGGAFLWQARVANAGPLEVTAPELRLRFPPEQSYRMLSACSAAIDAGPDAGTLVLCPVGTLDAGAEARFDFELVASSRTEARFVEASASAQGELDLTNNTTYGAFLTTPPSGPAIPLTAPVTFDALRCAGTLISSWAQCVPGSRLGLVLDLLADGGLLADGSSGPGFWAVGPTGGTVAIVVGEGFVRAAYLGASVDGGCFEGAVQNGEGRVYAGAFRMCKR